MSVNPLEGIVMIHLPKILFVVLLACVAPAHALDLPTCIPSRIGFVPLGGSGSPVQTVRTSIGTGYAYKCLDGSVNWKAVRSDYNGPTAADLMAEALTYKTPAEAIRALWSKYDQPPASDPQWAQLAAKTLATANAIVFGYVVARNGTALTRPAYAVTNGIRATVSTKQVSVGSACKCVVAPAATGSFCLVGIASNYAAICVAAGT